jgi:hypothetical protein
MIRATIRIIGGIILTVVGLLGLLFPIMPGWIFLIPGLVLLADHFRPVRRLLDWAKQKATGLQGATGGFSSGRKSPPPNE